jgi:hypothetical protein
MPAAEDASRQIADLVDRFARNLDIYTRPDYKETQLSVERMLDLQKNPVEATDEEIAALVYELYGMTEKKIAIVEGRA